MKRVYTLLIAIIAAILLVSPILAAYYATFTVTESDGNAYTMLPVMVDSPNTWMVNNGFMQADAMDTRVETLGGTAQPHMVTDNRVLSALVVPDNSQTNLYFTTLESTNLTSMDIIIGSGGFITTTDHADLSVGDNFTLSFGGYWDTDNGTNKFSVNQSTGIRFFVSPTVTGNITAHLTSTNWTSPTSDAAIWTNPGNAYDGNPATIATNTIAAASWSPYLTLSIAARECESIRFYIDRQDASISNVDIEVYWDAAWHDVYEANGPWLTWTNVSLNATHEVTSMRIRMQNTGGGARQGRVGEMYFDTIMSLSATGIASGAKTVELIAAPALASSSNLSIVIDGVVEATTVMSANVTDPANDWVWMMEDVMPYADNITVTIGGNRQLYYCPNDMIQTTVLPDRQGTAQNGAITWGANPSGVSVVLGSLVSDAQPVVGSTIDETPRDIIEEVEVSDWFEAPDVSGTLQTNPMRPFVTMMSDTTTITELQAWRLLGLAFVLLCTAGAAALARGHLLIVGIAGGAAIGACCALTIFPLWMLIFAIGAVAGGLVAERSPSL